MATVDINSLRNNVSTGSSNQQLNSPNYSANMFKPPVSIQTIDENLIRNVSIGTLQFPVDRPKYYTHMKISRYSRTSLLKLGDLNMEQAIILPLPSGMINRNDIAYDENVAIGTPLGATVEGAAGAAGYGRKNTSQNLPQLMKSIQSSATGVVGENVPAWLSSVLGGVGGIITQQVTGAASGLGLGPLGQVAQAALGYSPNQFFTILLKGPRYKRFSFSWRMSPRNEEEAKMLKDIVLYINNAAAPGLVLGGAIFTFPMVFELSFMPNPQYLFKMKPAVVESISANYAPSGIPAFYRASSGTNGLNAPEAIQVDIHFLELEYWASGDWKDNNDPYDR